MITYDQIEQVNSKMTTIQLGTGAKKKDYVMVPQRVKAFRMLYPEGFIQTRILSHENNIVTMQTEVGYYSETGDRIVLGTGTAFEEKGKGMVNGTSYIENCETSAVGRALGFLGLGVDAGGICSAEELTNALIAQEQIKSEKPKPITTKNATITQGATIPQTPTSYIIDSVAKLKEKYGDFDFAAVRLDLISDGEIENKSSAEMTMDEARDLINKAEQRLARDKG